MVWTTTFLKVYANPMALASLEQITLVIFYGEIYLENFTTSSKDDQKKKKSLIPLNQKQVLII